MYCSAINCSNNRKHHPGLSFHSFPIKDKGRLAKWVQNTHRVDYDLNRMINYFLCDEHFEETTFMCPAEKYMKKPRKRLMPNAVPTLFNIPNPPPNVANKRRIIVKTPLAKRAKMGCVDIEQTPLHGSDHKTIETNEPEDSMVQIQKIKANMNKLRVQNHQLQSALNDVTEHALHEDMGNVSAILHDPANSFLVDILRNSNKLHKWQHRWSDEMKTVCLSIYFHSKRTYAHLQKIFPMPSISTLRKLLQAKKLQACTMATLCDGPKSSCSMTPNVKLECCDIAANVVMDDASVDQKPLQIPVEQITPYMYVPTTEVRKRKSGVSCSGINCDNMYHYKSSVSYFRFPRDKERCYKWMINCRKKHLVKLFEQNYMKLLNLRICSLHFEASQFMNRKTRNRLIANALPTVFGLHKPTYSITSTAKQESLCTSPVNCADSSADRTLPMTEQPKYRNVTDSILNMKSRNVIMKNDYKESDPLLIESDPLHIETGLLLNETDPLLSTTEIPDESIKNEAMFIKTENESCKSDEEKVM